MYNSMAIVSLWLFFIAGLWFVTPSPPTNPGQTIAPPRKSGVEIIVPDQVVVGERVSYQVIDHTDNADLAWMGILISSDPAVMDVRRNAFGQPILLEAFRPGRATLTFTIGRQSARRDVVVVPSGQ